MDKWSTEFENQIYALFMRVFEHHDLTAVAELRRYLTEEELNVGLVAGFLQLDLDGNGTPESMVAFEELKKEMPWAADLVLKSLSYLPE